MNNRKLKKWINKTLGRNIKKLRLERELSEQYVSTKMKISLKKYRKLEKGYYAITVLQGFYVSEIFDVSISYIVQDLDSMPF